MPTIASKFYLGDTTLKSFSASLIASTALFVLSFGLNAAADLDSATQSLGIPNGTKVSLDAQQTAQLIQVLRAQSDAEPRLLCFTGDHDPLVNIFNHFYQGDSANGWSRDTAIGCDAKESAVVDTTGSNPVITISGEAASVRQGGIFFQEVSNALCESPEYN